MYEEVDPNSASNQVRRLAITVTRLPRSARKAIYRLLKAHHYAEDAGRGTWEFAVTISELRRDGISESDLRWLVCRGYIEHATELTTSVSERAFDRQASLQFSNHTAFVISPVGITYSYELLSGSARYVGNTQVEVETRGTAPQPSRLTEVQESGNGCNGHCHPKWDRDRRELRVGGQLVKVFKVPSPMQEAILMAFEEEKWPPRIYDPLPAHPVLLPKRRLHDTIKSLNRNQKNSLIRFMGDGTGEGIHWEMVTSKAEAELSNSFSQ